MESGIKEKKLTAQQQRVLTLLFKFRFVSAGLLADIMGIKKASTYEVLEVLTNRGLLAKVYEPAFRIDRRPAYYYLNKQGVTTVRKVLDVKESVVHALYKNDEMTDDFVDHCLKTMQCFVAIRKFLPEGSDIFSKTEINRFRQFPKNRPDLYIRTPSGDEAVIILVDDKPQYIVRKRFDEIVTHSEDEGWDGDYPHICFVLRDERAKYDILYTSNKKLEGMGMEDDELRIRAAALKSLDGETSSVWSSPSDPRKRIRLFD